ncbi:MAG: hypothetical protein KC589_10100 [Nanoarchaeota archaeon]|nr:hypothetical protein [Nanoarchaeota archaeon]
MESTEEIYFELPNSPIKGIPLIYSDNRINIGFMEVGCKSQKKVAQLKNKKELFYKYWADIYKKKLGVSWFPNVFRIIAHYNPEDKVILNMPKYEVDCILTYQYISKKMLKDLSEIDKINIFNVVHNFKKKEILEDIIETQNAEKLHSLILARNEPDLSNLRGKMAEILALKDLEFSLPFGMNLYKNGDIRHFNRRYKNGTEIDGLLTFYDPSSFSNLISKLNKLKHLNLETSLNI